MNEPTFAPGDHCLYSTNARMTIAELAPQWNRHDERRSWIQRDIAGLVVGVTVVELLEKPCPWPVVVSFPDGTHIMTAPNTLTLVRSGERATESGEVEHVERTELARAVAA